MKQATSILFRGEEPAQFRTGFVGPVPQSQTLTDAHLGQYAPILQALHSLLTASPSRLLAAKMIDALQVYYRGVGSSDAADKLIYVFVALEMILLRDVNEPVQDNIATRMAFVAGKSIEERRSIIAAVKTGYKLRSAFIHHGVRVEDTKSADEFLLVAWHTFVKLLDAAQRHRDQNELIKALEDRKLQ
jgi:hypothetical protein